MSTRGQGGEGSVPIGCPSIGGLAAVQCCARCCGPVGCQLVRLLREYLL